MLRRDADAPKSPEALTAGKFEVFQDKRGGYRFNLLASNGHVIASSESYITRGAAESGTESVKRNAPDAPVLDRD